MPRTITGRGWFQFPVVNTKLTGTPTAPESPDQTSTVTGPVGRVASRSEYVSVSPSSTRSSSADSTSAGASSSMTRTVTDPVIDL